MVIARKPFEAGRLEEEREYADIVNVRLNKDERRYLNVIKLCYKIDNDSTALKHKAFMDYKEAEALAKSRSIG